MLGARLASIESELAADDVDEEPLPPARSAGPASASGSAPGADAGLKPRHNARAKPPASAEIRVSDGRRRRDFSSSRRGRRSARSP